MVTAVSSAENPIAYTTTNFDKTVTALVLRTIAENIRRKTIWLQPGSYMTGTLIPGTNLIRHIKYSDMSIAATLPASDGTAPWLVEGKRPDSEALSITYDEFGVNQAGRVLAVTDRALKYSPHDLMSVAAERIAWNALSTFDLVIANTVVGITGTNTNGHNKGALVVGDVLTADLVRRQVADLRTAGIPDFNGYYYAMIHPYVVYDLQGDAKWVNVANYAAPENMLNGEIGSLYGVRFIQNTVGTWLDNTSGAGTVPAYSTLFFGREFFAFGDFGSTEAFMVRPGGDHIDPLAQMALVGWKGWIGAKVLTTLQSGSQARAIRLVHSSSIPGVASI